MLAQMMIGNQILLGVLRSDQAVYHLYGDPVTIGLAGSWGGSEILSRGGHGVYTNYAWSSRANEAYRVTGSTNAH